MKLVDEWFWMSSFFNSLYTTLFVHYSTLLHLQPSDFTVSEDAAIKPRTVATWHSTAWRSNLPARSHPLLFDGNLGNATILADPMEDSLKCRPFTCLIFENILLSAGGSIASATVQLELVEDAALTPTEIQLFHSRNTSVSNPLRFFSFFKLFVCFWLLNFSARHNQFRTHLAEFFPHK